MVTSFTEVINSMAFTFIETYKSIRNSIADNGLQIKDVRRSRIWTEGSVVFYTVLYALGEGMSWYKKEKSNDKEKKW